MTNTAAVHFDDLNCYNHSQAAVTFLQLETNCLQVWQLKRSIGIGDREQPTVTKTASILQIVVLIRYNLMRIYFLSNLLLNAIPFLFSFILSRLSSHMSRKSYAKKYLPSSYNRDCGYKRPMNHNY